VSVFGSTLKVAEILLRKSAVVAASTAGTFTSNVHGGIENISQDLAKEVTTAFGVHVGQEFVVTERTGLGAVSVANIMKVALSLKATDRIGNVTEPIGE